MDIALLESPPPPGSSGRVIEHNCNDRESLLLKNLALKNYKSSAVGVVKFGPLRDHVFEQVGKEMRREIQMYTTTPDASLKYHGDIKKLADYRNDQLIKDAAEKLPIVDTIIKAAFPGHKARRTREQLAELTASRGS